MAKVPLAGTSYIPGVTEERALARIENMIQQHLVDPVRPQSLPHAAD